MADPTSNSTTFSNLLTTHRALLDIFTSFLTVVTHHILYIRRIYPPVSFVSTRAFDYPVQQNRHPAVCAWINDAIAAVRDQMERNTVEKVALCIFECHQNRVLERWTFDLQNFPAVAKEDCDVQSEGSEDVELSRKINVTDLEATFRATLSRINGSLMKLKPLPEGPECSFTMTLDVKDSAERPVGRIEKHERQWVAAEPKHFKKRRSSSRKSKEVPEGLGKTHPVRRLEAGEMILEVWVEESAVKYTFPPSKRKATDRNASMSHGAGNKKFKPAVGYELEKPNINRKPGGGTSTDYQRG